MKSKHLGKDTTSQADRKSPRSHKGRVTSQVAWFQVGPDGLPYVTTAVTNEVDAARRARDYGLTYRKFRVEFKEL